MKQDRSTCLITGGSGFQGRHLTEALLNKGYRVRNLDRFKPAQPPKEDYEFLEGDFAASHQIADAISGCDVIFHLAYTTLPQTSNDDPDFDISSNVLGTVRMLDLAVKAGVKRFIFLSSGGTVYGNLTRVPVPENHPTNPTCSYGITKLAIEKYLRLYHQLHGLNSLSVRLSNPYGEYQRFDSRQGAVAAFCHKILTGNKITIWGDGSVKRDFIYIADVIGALIRMIDAPVSGCEMNIGSGEAVSLNGLIGHIEEITGLKADREYTPGRTFDIPVSELDIAFARESLRWQPAYSIRDGLVRTLDWMENFLKIS